MADFQFKPLTHSPERLNVVSTKLGASSAQVFTDADVGKAMKMGPVGNHLLCADGDEIEGFVDNIDPGPKANGFVFGGVARPNAGARYEAQVAAGVSTPLVFGDLVVAGAQIAVGTKGIAQVKKGTPATFKWRVINLYGNGGVAGSTVLLERL